MFIATITTAATRRRIDPNELVAQYQTILAEQRLSWTSHLRLIKLLGSGGQGVVYQTELRGTDEFTLPAAHQDLFARAVRRRRSYDEAMRRVGPRVRPHRPDSARQSALRL